MNKKSIKKIAKKLVIGIIALLVIGIPLLYLTVLNSKPTQAAWYDDSWGFRKAVTVTVTSSASDITNLETLITVDTTGITASLQTSCEDLRFTNQAGKLLPYYAPSCSDNSATNKVWVLLDLVPKNTTTYTLYMYYGNPSAPAASDSNKFRLFDSLVGYWTLNESSGNRSDSSVNSNTLTDNNTVTSAAGQYSNAGQFTAANSEYLSIADNASVSTGDIDFTVTAWAYADSLGNRAIVSKQSGDTAGEYQLAYVIAGDLNKFRFLLPATSESVSATVPSPASTGTWYFIVAWHDATANTINIQVDNGTVYTTSSVTAPADTNATFRIGAGSASGDTAAYYWDGRIDDVRYYKRVLSAGERTQLYNTPGTIASTANATVKPSTSFATEEKAPGPVAYWGFDEGTGTNAQDSTTNNLDGTLNNTPTWTTEDQCVSGKCLYFDGTSNENVSKADDAKLDFVAADNFTISAWVKRSGASSANNFIITKAQAGYTGYKLYQDASGDYCFDVSDGTNTDTACTSAVEFDDNSWHHVMGVKSGTTSITLYVDGRQRAQDASIAATGTLANTGTFYIGVDLDGTSNEWLGYIDEIKVYPYARTAAQVLADYNSRGSVKGSSVNLGSNASNTPPNVTEGLVSYWKMDDNVSGNTKTLVDSATGGNNGTTYYGANATGMDCTVAGKYNGGCNLDGTDDYVDVAHNSVLAPTTLTLSAWINPTTSASTRTIFYKISGASPYYGYVLQLTSSDTVQFQIFNNDGGTLLTTTSTVTNGSWQHLVATYDGSTMLIYLNRVQIGNQAASSKLGASTANALGVGYNVLNTNNYYKGSIDEVRIYNRALSADDVSTLYGQAPVGYWNFEEGSGTSAKDTSGNANTGTLGGDGSGTDLPTWATGKIGKSLKFDGSDDYVDAGDVSALQFERTDGFTIEAWIKTSSTNSYQSIFQKGNGSSPYTGYWFRQYSTSGELSMQLYDAEGDRIGKKSVATINNGTWRHVAVTYNGSSTSSGIKLYIDGNLATDTDDNSGTFDSSIRYTISAYIGKDSVGSQFDGSIDDVKIYNYARTQKQIVSDMNGGHPSVGSPVGSAVGHWDFDEGQGTTANNSGSQGTSLAGTLTGMSAPATSTSGWTQAGKFGKALIFDGSNDYVTLADTSALSITGNITLSAWIKRAGTGIGAIISKWDGGAETQKSYALQFNANNRLQLWVTSNGSTNSSTTDAGTQVTDSNWHHVAGVYTGSQLKVYLDGIEQTGATASYSSGIYDSTANFRIGIDDDEAAGTYFNGTIDEVKIYNYALTTDEVKVEYNKGSSLVLGASGNNSNYQANAANQEYCVPGDTTSCAPPVAGWDFEDASQGSSAQDTSGNAYTGTWNGTGSHWKPGKYGKAGNFNGSDDYVSMGDVELTNSNQISVSAWAKLGSSQVAYGSIASKSYDSYAYSLHIDQTDTSKVGFTTTSWTNKAKSNSSLNDNKWHHLVGTYDGATIKLYVDGVLQSQTGTDTANIANTADYLMIGAGGKSGSTNYFINGQIDQVRVFNYVRSPAQIAWDYNKGGPVGHWKFDECQGDRANDSSGNGNHGTIAIGASGEDTIGTCNTSSTAWGSGATGKRNASLSLDGTDDYVDFSNNASLQITSTITASAWFKADSSGSGSGIVVGKHSATASNWGWDIYYDFDNNQVCMGMSQTGSNWDSKCVNATEDTWHHVTGVFNGSTINVYVDGISNSKSTSLTAIYNTTANATSGGLSASNYFKGSLDEVKIFNYALTATQIKTLYNNGAVNFGPTTGSP